jgi:osmoprotectant transport system permease protein
VSLLEFYERNAGEALHLLVQHLLLVGASTLVAVAVGVPLGIVLTRRPRLAAPVLGVANVFQTIPSLALFGFLIPLPFLGGIGASTAVVALVVYALLPIIRNTYTGIRDIDPAVREAGRGMGMTDGELLRMVELPLALGVIMAGVRIATVIGVGVATIAAAIGAGGLGVYIFRGVAMVNDTLILAGALPAALMALAADFALGWLERRLTPRGIRAGAVRRAAPRAVAHEPARS